MAFTTGLWTVKNDILQRENRSSLESEKRLENWIANDLSLLGEDLLLIGRQTRTKSGPLDILAIDSDGTLVIIELKRHRTPREVVAQVLDYASWVAQQTPHDIDTICFGCSRRTLADAFRAHFDSELPEDACKSHRMIIVAAELDDSSERIIKYLQEQHEIDINAVFFSVYVVDKKEVLVRAWLSDPEETQERAERRTKPPWSGVWYVNHTENRDWELRRKFGFISAGGAPRFYKPLFKLNVGDTIAAYQRKAGYLGVGVVTSPAVPADEFRIGHGKLLYEVAPTVRGTSADEGERVVGIKWTATVPTSEAKTFDGVFANQNVVCKLRDAETVGFLMSQFDLPAGWPAVS